MSELLLDTCALIWTALGQDIGTKVRKAIEARPLHVSAISALEIGSLVRRNRLMLEGPATLWFDTVLRRLNARLSALPPALLIASTELAGDPPKDPFDRIMIATARERDLTLLTRDRVILAYCKSHNLAALAC